MSSTDLSQRPESAGIRGLPDATLWPGTLDEHTTGVVLTPSGDGLPVVRWIGVTDSLASATPGEIAAAVDALAGDWGVPLLTEGSRGWFTRPALRGHRLAGLGEPPVGGRDWSTAFRTTEVSVDTDDITIDAVDEHAGLEVRTTIESVAGGALRARHELTNRGSTAYVLDGLEVLFPVADHLTEVLDFTGLHLNERVPQRRPLTDGLWVREGRRGKTGLDAATLLAVGTPGFDETSGEVLGVHVGWSGNSLLRLERDNATAPSIGGGELLLPGEMVLAPDESYRTPWVWVVASHTGLDGLATAFHDWQRSLPAHPDEQPVTLNVWEAVYFDHDAGRLHELAQLAAEVGVERFVLDDGWFHARRDSRAGLGDWWVDPEVWPDGLTPLIDRVHELGMQFGLWFEPEMVNPDSDLYREHPDWILSAGDRIPHLHRNQLVLDLSRPEVSAHILAQVDAVLRDHAIDYVKWDHNRDLLEAGSGARGGAPAVHRHTEAYYALLDELRRRHPSVAWESCASGGGRIDLEVLSRVQRVWTSDMTDALSRQQIQRWTAQLVAPEYLGAHVSAPSSHQTDRTFSLDFRAAIALWGAFGIEWDLTSASAADRDRLAEWIALFKRFRGLLHGGRMVRPRSSDPSAQLNGVIARDRSEALVAAVQVDVPVHGRGLAVRVPGLDAARLYTVRRISPGAAVDDDLRLIGDTPVPGETLGTVGVRISGRRRPEVVTLLHYQAVDGR